MITQYDSRQSLRSAAKHLERSIGVYAGAPFHHRGLNAVYVDIARETIYVNSIVKGNACPAGDVAAETVRQTEQTIADLTAVIDELAAHRDRLVAELEHLTTRQDWITEKAKSTS